MEELIKAFSSESVIFLIVSFPVMATIAIVYYVGKSLQRLEDRVNKFGRIILLFVLSHNGEKKKARDIAKKMMKDSEEDIEEEIANL